MLRLVVRRSILGTAARRHVALWTGQACVFGTEGSGQRRARRLQCSKQTNNCSTRRCAPESDRLVGKNDLKSHKLPALNHLAWARAVRGVLRAVL